MAQIETYPIAPSILAEVRDNALKYKAEQSPMFNNLCDNLATACQKFLEAYGPDPAIMGYIESAELSLTSPI